MRPTTETIRIAPRPPFDLGRSIEFLRGFTPCSGDQVCGNCNRALTAGGFARDHPFVAHVSESGDGVLAAEIRWLDGDGDADAVARWLRSFLSLDDDLTGLYAVAASDPAFQRVVDDLHGYHHVRFATPFEAACWAALSQRTPMHVARRLKRSLAAAFGRVEPVDGQDVLLFPTPGRVLDNATAVEGVVGHDRKARTVVSAAEALQAEDLTALTDDALRARLGEVWGFGEWSSEFVALRGFGRLSGLPRTERRLRQAVAKLYALDGDEATDADLDRLSRPYAPLRGYWAHYIRVWVG